MALEPRLRGWPTVVMLPADTCGSALCRADRANRLFLHPIHPDAYNTLVSLITDLRQCRSFEDFYHFQQTLLEEILKIQGHGQACA
jgi:hypothetical protein